MDFMNLVYIANFGIGCMLNVFFGSLSSPFFFVTPRPFPSLHILTTLY
jgi:hypothetical protein